MKTLEEIARYRRKIDEIARECLEAGFTSDNTIFRGALDALDWAMSPSDNKEDSNVEKQITYKEAQGLRKVLAKRYRKRNKGKTLPWDIPVSATIQEIVNLYLEGTK